MKCPLIDVDKAINFQDSLFGLNCHTRVTFFFEQTATGPVYVSLLQTFILHAIHQPYWNKPFCFQQDDIPPYYYCDVISYLSETLPGQYIGRKGSAKYPICPPDLTLLDIYLWGSLKDQVYHGKSPKLGTLWEGIEMCSAIPVDTIGMVAHTRVH
jgi:hypothetical protein